LDQRLAADHVLQSEICHALQSLAECLLDMTDMRLARAIKSVLEPSWQTHQSLQERVLFPIVMRQQCSPDLEKAIHTLQRDHGQIGKLHTRLNEKIERFLQMPELERESLEQLLLSTIDARRKHFVQEEKAVASLPSTPFTAADRELMQNWLATLPEPSFPLSLLLGFRY
jgi:hemerythrin-like domain-containing protein